MKFDIVFRNQTGYKKFKESFFKAVLNTAFEVLKFKKNIELSVNLVSEKDISRLNKKYRGLNKTTDVLSFPLGEHKSYDILPLGDIFICPGFAVKEAAKLNIAIEKEMAWLAIHGVLHLLGFDHEKSKKAAGKMSKTEQLILKKWENRI
ncbi:MAG: putative rRNA maturation factor [Candidatus Yanofskybacteria bacterium GW2011_GWA1_44_21]|uniref:Endoribonuclease YbeY n=2 Tax=Candidatus Yanofskyibacteriota TaxID=1752733 RepID=A0A1F8H120_9BACT|nr:MAG: putative rRNA maturation factor [Candidatus Yanofskybacteria bacterium GW2011_GWA2_44_10]KKT50670.1 MAG: putative rRNA maturation factor [Candidatus Yanofskybacteria bacterium GW2011_GWA1_44_21]KKT90198.1 MAG: putative rRNA maturation factor [Candidatus Yanofskybacteria bacterium GW2011_GWB1_45_11]OGN14864.1 MAG: rRNA maturation RNase YbeY [Candidatus Yanofskybacteria bacterium RIFCSPHIGHO2_02_FULL_44_36b]OGN19141.1 MAG: rRNA maturation RNase YbeY [Candidatus Yanofskybacteria bacterium 